MSGYSRNIKLLHWLIKLGSIQKAADHVGVTRQAASRMILNMEAEYGIDIVKRSSNSMKVTSAGIGLAEVFGEFLRKTDLIKEQNFTDLVISSSRFIVDNLVAGAAEVMRVSTGAKFTFLGDDTCDAYTLNKCDIYIGPANIMRNEVKMIPISYPNTYKLYAHPSYLQNKGVPLSTEELNDHDLIVYGDYSSTTEGFNFWGLFDDLFAENEVKRPSFIINSVEGMISLAQQGLGIVALTPAQALKAPDLAPVLENIEGEGSQLYIQYCRRSPKKSLIKQCVDDLLNAMAEMQQEETIIQQT